MNLLVQEDQTDSSLKSVCKITFDRKRPLLQAFECHVWRLWLYTSSTGKPVGNSAPR